MLSHEPSHLSNSRIKKKTPCGMSLSIIPRTLLRNSCIKNTKTLPCKSLSNFSRALALIQLVIKQNTSIYLEKKNFVHYSTNLGAIPSLLLSFCSATLTSPLSPPSAPSSPPSSPPHPHPSLSLWLARSLPLSLALVLSLHNPTPSAPPLPCNAISLSLLAGQIGEGREGALKAPSTIPPGCVPPMARELS